MTVEPPKGPARKVVTGRKRNSVTGFVPVPAPKGTGLVAFESLHEERMIVLIRDDASVSRMWGQPETFAWRDDGTGQPRQYTPDFLVEFADGSRAYREVKPSDKLLDDPDLEGRRVRIEEECRVRGARFEVWTEREIEGDDPFIRVATDAERSSLEGAGAGDLTAPDDGLPNAAAGVARELRIERGLALDGVWVGRSGLTGLVTTVRCKPLPVPRWARSSR